MSEYYPPTYKSEEFHCRHCHVYAAQDWSTVYLQTKPEINLGHIESIRVEVSLCSHCKDPTFWLAEKMIHPPAHTAPPANSDLPNGVKKFYEEASAVADQSPRAACALLRLAIEQLLLKELGETGSINDAIKNLVKKGLNPQIQQSLDIVRVTGNNAVHPGVIKFDDATDVQVIFKLINAIADALITQPKNVKAIYDNLPESHKKAIEKRDGKAK